MACILSGICWANLRTTGRRRGRSARRDTIGVPPGVPDTATGSLTSGAEAACLRSTVPSTLLA